MPSLTTEEVLDRAQRWARMHKVEKYRPKMDDLLKGLSEADQRRVYLCGQRISGGLPPKVLPAANGKEDKNEKEKGKAAAEGKRREGSNASRGSTTTAQGTKAVGADSKPAKTNHARKDSRNKKR